jgi:large subunit ribosomal protein L3
LRGAVPGTDGSYVKIRDAVKRAAPADLPKPGAIKSANGDAAPAAAEPVEAPEAETIETGGETS